eukprot:7269687-Prymnesium_polylepis.1
MADPCHEVRLDSRRSRDAQRTRTVTSHHTRFALRSTAPCRYTNTDSPAPPRHGQHGSAAAESTSQVCRSHTASDLCAGFSQAHHRAHVHAARPRSTSTQHVHAACAFPPPTATPNGQ